MKFFLLLCLLISSTFLSAQSDWVRTQVHKNPTSIDSIVNLIDKDKLKIWTDTIVVYNSNYLDSIDGFYVEQFYFEKDTVLKIAIIYGIRGEKSVFYFRDKLLIKVNVFDKNKQSKQYYYNEIDNDNSPFAIDRLQRKYSEYKEYFENLRLGMELMSYFLRETIYKN